MHPILVEIGSFALRSYGLMAALGFLAGVGIAMLNRKYAKMTTDQLNTLCFFSILIGIAGARLFYVVQYWHQFRGHLPDVVRIDKGGLVYYGGFLLVLAFIYLYCRKNKLSVLRVMDVCAPGLALGHAFGRVGCFLNGCCFGKPGGGAFGSLYPAGSEAFMKYGHVALHPVQLYEAVMNLALFPLLFLLTRKEGKGISTATYLILYGLIRFTDEFFRGDHSAPFMLGMTRAQVIGLVLIPIGAALLIYRIRQNKNESQIEPIEG
jgi:phosphatidylglycerol:prolipoprotein diacylglycerol transferase